MISTEDEFSARGVPEDGLEHSIENSDRILAKAALGAARYLHLSERAAEQMVAPELRARFRDGAGDRNDVTPEHRERALDLVRIFRALDAILPEQEAAVRWLHGPNVHLRNCPLALLEQGRGEDVLAYLERARSR